MAKPKAESVNVADAKRQFSDLLGRVAYGGETILITKRGRPMARLVPPEESEGRAALDGVQGWLADDDLFLGAIDEIVSARSRHRPRVLARSGKRHSR